MQEHSILYITWTHCVPLGSLCNVITRVASLILTINELGVNSEVQEERIIQYEESNVVMERTQSQPPFYSEKQKTKAWYCCIVTCQSGSPTRPPPTQSLHASIVGHWIPSIVSIFTIKWVARCLQNKLKFHQISFLKDYYFQSTFVQVYVYIGKLMRK